MLEQLIWKISISLKIDIFILDMIGFKNTVYELKDKNGNTKIDEMEILF